MAGAERYSIVASGGEVEVEVEVLARKRRYGKHHRKKVEYFPKNN